MPDWQSMTGFGRAESRDGNWTIAVEMRSVNQRGRDVRVSTSPRNLALEHQLVQLVGKRLNRGKVDVRVEAGQQGSGTASLDPVQLNRLKSQQFRQRIALGRALPVDASALQGARPVVPEQLVLDTARSALASLIESRRSEGLALHQVLAGQLDDIRAGLDKLVAGRPSEQAARATVLADKVRELQDSGISVQDAGRIEEELAALLMRSDITEELDRLDHHLQSAAEMLAADGPVGRKIDVLVQEMGREIHTISSKSAWIDAKTIAVDLRATVEQLREQVQNIE